MRQADRQTYWEGKVRARVLLRNISLQFSSLCDVIGLAGWAEVGDSFAVFTHARHDDFGLTLPTLASLVHLHVQSQVGATLATLKYRYTDTCRCLKGLSQNCTQLYMMAPKMHLVLMDTVVLLPVIVTWSLWQRLYKKGHYDRDCTKKETRRRSNNSINLQNSMVPNSVIPKGRRSVTKCFQSRMLEQILHTVKQLVSKIQNIPFSFSAHSQ